MTLEDLGYNEIVEQYRRTNQFEPFIIGRIIAEHKERYIVKNQEGEYDAEITGHLRFTAQNRSDYPAVGDWVAFTVHDENKGLIHALFPRQSMIERAAVGKFGEKQIIGTNIEYAFIVQAVDRDYNLNRIERYLTISHASGVKPIILLTKIDLIRDDELAQIISTINKRLPDIKVIALSNETNVGLDQLQQNIEKGKTYCLLGSSGVGKSTVINNLLGVKAMRTDAISLVSDRGKHVTTHRELHVLKNGGIMIDNPGMREVGIADAGSGIELTFDTIYELAQACKYKNCTHTNEPGCAVLAGLENESIEQAAYENYLKMGREKEHFEMSLMDKRKKDKAMGKMMKNYKKNNFFKQK